MIAVNVRRRPRGLQERLASLLVFGIASLLYISYLRPTTGLDSIRTLAVPRPPAQPAMNAYGRSGQVHMRFALPSEPVDFPLEVMGDPARLRYLWMPLRSGRATTPLSLANALVAPAEPGFYRLVVLGDSSMRVFDDISLAVLVPFKEKSGSTLNGYRIGRYRGERYAGDRDAPPLGFLRIDEPDLDIQLTAHLRLADFVTHDGQSVWPRYAALDPRLLDKLELVFGALSEEREGSAASTSAIEVDVHSGFRTPLYNRRIARAASDSRHQYGDAADISIDVNQDGRVNARDVRLVAMAVEEVERQHPDLAGGLGLYTRNGSPYVHVDARGTRARWRG